MNYTKLGCAVFLLLISPPTNASPQGKLPFPTLQILAARQAASSLSEQNSDQANIPAICAHKITSWQHALQETDPTKQLVQALKDKKTSIACCLFQKNSRAIDLATALISSIQNDCFVLAQQIVTILSSQNQQVFTPSMHNKLRESAIWGLQKNWLTLLEKILNLVPTQNKFLYAQLLSYAVEDTNIPAVRLVLSHHPEPKTLGIKNQFMAAAAQGSIPMLAFLYPYLPDNRQTTVTNALNLPVLRGDLTTIRFLVEEFGANPTINNDYIITAAINSGRTEIVRYLLGKGATLHVQNDWIDDEYFISGAEQGHKDMIQFLKENTRTDDPATYSRACTAAAREGHTSVVAYFIEGENGIDPNIPLKTALENTQSETTTYLLDHGAHLPTDIDRFFIRAAATNNPSMLTLLEPHLTHRKTTYTQACATAAQYNHLTLVQSLATKDGIKPTDILRKVASVMRKKKQNISWDVIETLLRHSTNIHYNNNDLLLSSVIRGDLAITQNLIERYDADPASISDDLIDESTYEIFDYFQNFKNKKRQRTA